MNSAATSYVEITNHKSCKIQHRSLPRHPGWACRLICSFYIELRRVGTAKSIVLTIFDLSKWYKSYATLNISYALYICQDGYQMSSLASSLSSLRAWCDPLLLFGYFSPSSTSNLKFKWLSACFRGSSPWQTERILHLLTPTFLCLMQQPATSLQ